MTTFFFLHTSDEMKQKQTFIKERTRFFPFLIVKKQRTKEKKWLKKRIIKVTNRSTRRVGIFNITLQLSFNLKNLIQISEYNFAQSTE